MKRTKILTVLAALLLILGLAACGMSKDGKENEGSKETGIASLLAADPKTTDEASELHQKLMQQETAILSENNSLWEKVFMSGRQRYGNDRGRRQLRRFFTYNN